MLDRIRDFLAGRAERPRPGAAGESSVHRLDVAVCALLLEIAHADDVFTAEEKQNIEEVMARHFDLSPEAAGELMALAEQWRSEAVDLYQFTSVITANYDEGQRMVLAEALWRVVYADGRLSSHEEYLMSKLAILLDLRPGYLTAARKRAMPARTE